MAPPSNSQRPQRIFAIHRLVTGFRKTERLLLPEEGPAVPATGLEPPPEPYPHRDPYGGILGHLQHVFEPCTGAVGFAADQSDETLSGGHHRIRIRVRHLLDRRTSLEH